MAKKLIALLLALGLTFTLAACGGEKTADTSSQGDTAVASTVSDDASSNEEEAASQEESKEESKEPASSEPVSSESQKEELTPEEIRLEKLFMGEDEEFNKLVKQAEWFKNNKDKFVEYYCKINKSNE